MQRTKWCGEEGVKGWWWGIREAGDCYGTSDAATGRRCRRLTRMTISDLRKELQSVEEETEREESPKKNSKVPVPKGRRKGYPGVHENMSENDQSGPRKDVSGDASEGGGRK